MFTLTGEAKVFLYQGSVDMRKSFESLSFLIEEAFPGLLLSGSFFVFLSRRSDRMKVLYFDKDGFAIWYKRLEKGSFKTKHKNHALLSRTEFFMLLEGIQPKHIQKRWKNMPEP